MRRSVLTASMIAILALPLLLVIAGSGKESTLQPAEDIRNNPTSHRVRAALVDAFGYDAANIVVGVEENVAVLSGDVRERSTQVLAQQVAESVNGIVVVHNFLQVGDELGRGDHATNDRALRTRLSGALGANIVVDACDGVVVLRGDLPDDEHRDAAIRIAENLSGVARVIDLIQVAWSGPISGLPGALAFGTPAATAIDVLTPMKGEK